MAPVFLVTGASSGIGEATARRLAHEPGATLVLVARREERLRALAESLPTPVTRVAADLTDDAAPARIAAHVEERHGRLDLLVNNAGILQTGPLADIPLADQQRTVEVNVIGVLNGCHAAHPHLKATPGSQVVNLCSASAIYGQPELAEGGGRLPHRVHRAVGAQAKAMLAASAMSPSWLNRLVNARITR